MQFLAGGTTLDRSDEARRVEPGSRWWTSRAWRADTRHIESGSRGLRLGAFAKMAAVANHPAVLNALPCHRRRACSWRPVRSCATWRRSAAMCCRKPAAPIIGIRAWPACNKRVPGSGCAAITGFNRNHAVLGVDDSCIAQYPGDFAVALIALDAQVELSGPDGARRIPFAALHRPRRSAPSGNHTPVRRDHRRIRSGGRTLDEPLRIYQGA